MTKVSLKTTAKLQANILVIVRVKVACGPYDETEAGDNSVSVEQAVGDQIASARGSISGASIVCDGLRHAYSAKMLADPSGPPFQAGPAVASAHVTMCGTVDNEFSCSGGSAGPRVIDLIES